MKKPFRCQKMYVCLTNPLILHAILRFTETKMIYFIVYHMSTNFILQYGELHSFTCSLWNSDLSFNNLLHLDEECFHNVSSVTTLWVLDGDCSLIWISEFQTIHNSKFVSEIVIFLILNVPMADRDIPPHCYIRTIIILKASWEKWIARVT